MRNPFLVAALLAATTTPAGGEAIPAYSVVSAGGILSRDIADGLIDRAQAERSSPFLSREAYLALKPHFQTGGMPRVPDLLANGKCSDPASEGR